MCTMDMRKRAGMPHPATPPGLPPRDCRRGALDLTLHSHARTQGGADAFDPNQPYCHPDRPGRGGAARASRAGAALPTTTPARPSKSSSVEPLAAAIDIYARAVSRYLGRHIPATQPSWSRTCPARAARVPSSTSPSVAPRTALTIGATAPGAIIAPLLDGKMSQLFDPIQFIISAPQRRHCASAPR